MIHSLSTSIKRCIKFKRKREFQSNQFLKIENWLSKKEMLQFTNLKKYFLKPFACWVTAFKTV